MYLICICFVLYHILYAFKFYFHVYVQTGPHWKTVFYWMYLPCIKIFLNKSIKHGCAGIHNSQLPRIRLMGPLRFGNREQNVSRIHTSRNKSTHVPCVKHHKAKLCYIIITIKHITLQCPYCLLTWQCCLNTFTMQQRTGNIILYWKFVVGAYLCYRIE